MEKRKVKALFKAILSTLAEERGTPCFLEHPVFFFIQAMNLLFKENSEENEIRADYCECLQGFLSFLDEKEIGIDSRVRREMEEAIKAIKEQEKRKRMLMKDAISADFRHHKVLGDDY